MGLVESRLYALEFSAACQKAESSQIDGRAVPFPDSQTIDILRRAWSCLPEVVKNAIVDKNEQPSSQSTQRPEKRRKAAEYSAPSKRHKQKGNYPATSSHKSANVHLDFVSWFEDPLSFFQTDAALDWEHNSLAALYLSGTKLGPRSKIDTMRLRLIKVVFYHLKIKYGSDHLRCGFLKMITDIVKLSGAVNLDAETVNKTLSRWIDDGHRVDSLCQSLGMSNGKYLGHIFGSLGCASNEFVRVIPLKGEERVIKIQDLRKCGQPDEMTNSLASTIFAHVWKILDQRMKEALGDKAWEYQYDPLIWAHNEGKNGSTEETMLAPQSPEAPHGQGCDPGVRRPDSAKHLSNEGGVSSLPVDGYDPLRYINSIEPNIPASVYDPLRDINPVENGRGEGAYAFDPLKPVNRVRPQPQEHHGHLCHMDSINSNQLENGYNPLHHVNPVEVRLAEDGHDPFHFISPVGSDLPEGGYNPLHHVNLVEPDLPRSGYDPFHFISPVGSDLPEGGYNPLQHVNPVEPDLPRSGYDPFHFSPVGSDLPESGYNPLHHVNPVEPDLPRSGYDPFHFISPVGSDLPESGYNPLHHVNPVEPDLPSGYDPVHHISPVELQASVAPVNMNGGEDFTQGFSHSSHSHGMLDPRQIRSPQHSTNGSTTFQVVPVT